MAAFQAWQPYLNAIPICPRNQMGVRDWQEKRTGVPRSNEVAVEATAKGPAQ